MDRYFVIQEWMIRDFGLSGLDLLVFSIIYGFSQDNETEFFGSLSYLNEMTGYSKRSIINSLKKLVDAELLLRKETYVNSVRTVRYRVNDKKFNGGEETSPPVKKLHRGSEESSPNNIDYNIKNNNINIINNNKEKKEKKPRKFSTPTIEDVTEYCNSRNSPVNPKIFFEYFSAGNWTDSKGNPVLNWKQKLIMWENHNWGTYDTGSNTKNCRDGEGEGDDWSKYYDVY